MRRLLLIFILTFSFQSLTKADDISDFEIEIYNRWGQMVFKSKNIEEQWDGKFNDKISPSGTYVFRVKSKNLNNEEYLESGTVSLVR